MPPDSAPGAHFARKDHTLLRNPTPHSIEFQARRNLRSSPAQTPPANVADPNPHSAESKFPRVPSPAAPRSKKFARAQHAATPSAKALAARDNLDPNLENGYAIPRA